MDKLSFRKIYNDSSDIDKIETICNEAFPAQELPCTIRDFVGISETTGFISVLGIYDENTLVGFTVMADMEEYVYGLLIATDSSLRCMGYGSKVMGQIGDISEGRPLMAAIENPASVSDNTEQRLRRKAFYERNGLYISDVEISDNGMDYLIISTRADIPIKEYLDRYLEKANGIILEYLKDK